MDLAVGFIVGAILAAMIMPRLHIARMFGSAIKGAGAFWLITILLTLVVYFLLGGAWATGLIVGMVFGEIWG